MAGGDPFDPQDPGLPGGDTDNPGSGTLNPIPVLEVSYNGVPFINSSSTVRDIGSFVQNTSQIITVQVKNIGEAASILLIPLNGISITGGDGTIVSNPSSAAPVTLNSNASTTFTVSLTTLNTGSRVINFKILSNQTANPFFFNISFTVTTASSSSPDINVLKSSSIISSHGIVSLGDVPINTVSDIIFDIYNYGVPSLIIPIGGISVTSTDDAVILVTNPVSGGAATLSFGSHISFTIRLDTVSLGNKNAYISIISNDIGVNKNPYTITVSYNIAKAFDLIVKESAEEVSEDETINIGSFNKQTNILKTISASNRGIYYSIRILGVVSEGDVDLQNVPLLPFILQPNEVNVMQFTAKFGSSSLGRKTASIQFQWEVAS